MKNTGFDKALFKNAVIFNVKNMFRRTIDEATPQQIFQAVAYTVKDAVSYTHLPVPLSCLSGIHPGHWMRK